MSKTIIASKGDAHHGVRMPTFGVDVANTENSVLSHRVLGRTLYSLASEAHNVL